MGLYVLADYLSRAEHVSDEEFHRLRQRAMSQNSVRVGPEFTEDFSENFDSNLENQGGESTDASEWTKSIFGLVTSDSTATSASEASDSDCGDDDENHVMLIGAEARPYGPERPPIVLDAREGLHHPLRRRRARNARQPEPLPERDEDAEDDGLGIPHMQPQPAPPPRRLSAAHYHIIKSCRTREFCR